MAEIIKLSGFDEHSVEMSERFAEMIKHDEITHAIICCRTKDGEIRYMVFGEGKETYIAGLMERCKIDMLWCPDE